MTYTLPKWVSFRSTPGHGYYTISQAKHAEMKKVAPALLRPSPYSHDGSRTFEEDLEWTRFVIAFPDEFEPEMVESAIRSFRDCYPDEYAEHTGQPVKLEDSRELRRRKYYADHQDDWLVISASGSWHETVPAGFVGVVALKGSEAASRKGDGRCFLVPEADYRDRGEFEFVVPAGSPAWPGKE